MAIARPHARATRVAYALVAVVCALAFVLFATGCVYSDTITERIIDNEPDSLVDDTLSPKLINTVEAEMKTEALPRLDQDEDSTEQEKEEEDLPVYDGDILDALPQMAAAQAEYQQQAAQAGQTAHTASDEAKNENTGNEASSGEGQGEAEGDEGSSDGFEQIEEPVEEEEEEVQITDDELEESEGTEDDNPRDNESEEKEDDTPNQRRSGTAEAYTHEEGEEAPIPENVTRVAAVGNYAVIVSIVSGTPDSTSLVACDSQTLAKTSKLLANKGIANVQTLWDNDGSSPDDLNESLLWDLAEAGALDLVYYTAGSDMFSSEQKERLVNEYNINVYPLPELTSATAIRSAVETVGKTLANGGVEVAKDSYQSYLDIHDALVQKYSADGVTGGFDFEEGQEAAKAAPETVVTLFVDGWDYTARYEDGDGYLDTSAGIATATLGYATSPINYYLSMGGALNNAASDVMRKELKYNGTDYMGSGIVWQFSADMRSCSLSHWSGLGTEELYDLGNITGDDSFKNNLTWYAADRFGLGTDYFPAIIARDQVLGQLFEEASIIPGQVYYPYETIRSTEGGIMVGYWRNGESDGTPVQASIGNGQVAGAYGMGFQVYVNPKGLVQLDSSDPLCSWTQGSIESVLETSWAHWKFRNGSQDEFEQDVVDFYDSVYGYDVTDDLGTIEAGAAA